TRFITRPAESELKQLAEGIRKDFGFQHLDEIEQSLENEQDESLKTWASKMLSILQQRSFIAKQTSLKLQHLGRGLSLQQCMQLERDLQDIWFEHGDFIEG
ncbi:enoyl-CoA hydratase/isomerase family protein, partial [Klebsiella pneumoniae]|uniref:enoyl-CoA hydratase/isomerase family protein n=1 Tax=Klebsiella pneumoniae TaxID=573 RepID=UPI00224565AB